MSTKHILRDWFYAQPKWVRWTLISPLLAVLVPIIGVLCIVAKLGDWADQALYHFNRL